MGSPSSNTIFETLPTGIDGSPTVVDTSTLSGSIDLSPGETANIMFDVTNSQSGDTPTFGVIGINPSVGSITASDVNVGTFTYTITAAQWFTAGSPTSVDLVFDDSASTGIAVFTLNVTCFARGTAIATPSGEICVENLQIGDMIRTADGRDVAVKWVGRQTISTIFSGDVERLRLVRIAAGAFGNGLPRRDLRVTADHAMLIDGLLVNASALVNGTTIFYEPLSQLEASYEIFHVETEDHDVILAEGAATETYIDYVARRSFDNYDEYLTLYGEDRAVSELTYPRISTARMLPAALKRRIAPKQVA